WRAASALGCSEYASPNVASALRNAASDPNSDVRDSALRSLGWMPASGDNLGVLLAGLKDKDKGVRATAAESLGQLKKGPPEVVSALVDSLQDKDKDVRENAADAIGELVPSAKPAIPALRAVWNNSKEDSFVRSAAGRSLGKLGEQVDWNAMKN
ncbi:MAG TPA: HEAT repeat domain-containing protein, partial [Acidobacteriota bacterium]|nr:HEAT repeat domain-containing protein [Acidobacteriota bacterium]